MIGKQIDAHAECFHAAELGRVSQLAMLQSETVIVPRIFGRGALHTVEDQFRGLVTVGVRVNLHTGFERQIESFLQLFGRGVPKPVRRAVVVAGPTQPCRKTLNGTVGNDLDDTQAQAVGGQVFQFQRPVDQLARRQVLETP